MLTVQKFGGSSVADAEKLRRVAGIIADARRRGADVVAVLSAPGGTTDELCRCASELSQRPKERELDALLSTGELKSVALMAMLLNELGIPAVSLSGRQAGIMTDLNHGSARIKDIRTRRIREELGQGKVVLAAGFQGINDNDDVTTLGRGGSDTTAVALAAALGTRSCEIYSDVEGIYTADPRLVPDAKRLREINCEDMLKLARAGSKVLHARAVETAIKYGIPVQLLSSYVTAPGTLMSSSAERPELCGVTMDRNRGTVTVVGRGADTSILAEAVSCLNDKGICVRKAEIGDGLCTLTTEEDDALTAMRLIHSNLFC